MNILVLGSGGREHALSWKIAQDEKVAKVFVAPGNAGTATEDKCENVALDIQNNPEVIEFAKTKKNRYFEFKKRSALKNISFFEYDTNKVNMVQKEYNFTRLFEFIEKDPEAGIPLGDNEMIFFAHILFDNGYLTGENNCFGGSLEYRPIIGHK